MKELFEQLPRWIRNTILTIIVATIILIIGFVIEFFYTSPTIEAILRPIFTVLTSLVYAGLGIFCGVGTVIMGLYIAKEIKNIFTNFKLTNTIFFIGYTLLFALAAFTTFAMLVASVKVMLRLF